MITCLLLGLGQGNRTRAWGCVGLLQGQHLDACWDNKGKGAIGERLIQYQHWQVKRHLPKTLDRQVHL